MGGYFWMPYQYILDPNSASDFWIVRSINQPKTVPRAAHDKAYAKEFPALPSAPATAVVENKKEVEEATSASTAGLSFNSTWASTGTKIAPGSVARITWDTQGSVDRVKLMYCVHTWTSMFSSFTTIAEADNHGSFEWEIPADAVQDTRYYFRIESADDAAVASTSAYFEVASPAK